MRLDGSVEVELLLDTGAESTSLPQGLAAQLALPSGYAHERERREKGAESIRQQLEEAGLVVHDVKVHDTDGSSAGVHGVMTGPRPVYRLRSLQLGDREVRDLVVVEDEDTPVLGRDVLAKFDWILHGPRSELWLLVPK